MALLYQWISDTSLVVDFSTWYTDEFHVFTTSIFDEGFNNEEVKQHTLSTAQLQYDYYDSETWLVN